MSENWHCAKCGSLNSPRRSKCWQCGSDRPANIDTLSHPSGLPEWFIRVLTAVWPIELIFACILAPSVAVVVWSDEHDLVQLLGIAVLVGAVAYIIGFTILRSEWRHWFLGGLGCGDILLSLVLGPVFLVYYVLVASICRHIVLPIVFRIAGISGTRIPSVFGK